MRSKEQRRVIAQWVAVLRRRLQEFNAQAGYPTSGHEIEEHVAAWGEWFDRRMYGDESTEEPRGILSWKPENRPTNRPTPSDRGDGVT